MTIMQLYSSEKQPNQLKCTLFGDLTFSRKGMVSEHIEQYFFPHEIRREMFKWCAFFTFNFKILY